MSSKALSVHDLKQYFSVKKEGSRKRSLLKAVDGVNFDLDKGMTLGIVGESGCGKSTLARSILRLQEPTNGQVIFDGMNILEADHETLRKLRREMQFVQQDPLSALNPRMSIGVNIAEPLRFFGIGNKEQRRAKVREIMEVVGLKPDHIYRYPHEFSGGQCQRITIARALILRPKLIIFDEPVSALDVSIQAQILELLIRLQKDFSLTYVFISHDLSVVKRLCDRIAVMYLGRIVELADVQNLSREPKHPYTQALFDAIPIPDPKVAQSRVLKGLEGDVPSPIDPPPGCHFAPRCPSRLDFCNRVAPTPCLLESEHEVTCHLFNETLDTPKHNTGTSI